MAVLTQSMSVMIVNWRRTVVTAVGTRRLRCRVGGCHDRNPLLLRDGLVSDLLNSTGSRLGDSRRGLPAYDPRIG